jgi:hypothetical protein
VETLPVDQAMAVAETVVTVAAVVAPPYGSYRGWPMMRYVVYGIYEEEVVVGCT